MRRFVRAPAAAAACVLLVAGGTRAATFTVTKTADTADGVCDADCSLREAVIAANANDDADEIVLGPGTFTLSLVGDDATAQAGDLDVSASVTIRGAGAAQTTVDGAGIDRVFHLYNQFAAGRAVTIRDLTIRGGDARNRPAAVTGIGGGVLNDGLDATIEDCVIEENIASSGGGAANFGIPADLTLRRSVVRNNDAGSGGGVLSAYQSRLVVEDSTISGNAATSVGGGGLLFSTFAQATISGSTISDNAAAGDGGGVQAQDAAVTVANSTISGNAAGGPSGRGGGAFSTGFGFHQFAMTHATVSGNTAPGPGAQIAEGALEAAAKVGVQSPLTLANSIVSSGGSVLSGGVAALCSGPITSLGGNLSEDGSCGLAPPDDVTGADPLLGPLADNGGPTLTRAHAAESLAVGAGVESNCLETDQRGYLRDAACDAGAYEYGAAPGPVCGATAEEVRTDLAADLNGGGGTVGDAVICLRSVAGL